MFSKKPNNAFTDEKVSAFSSRQSSKEIFSLASKPESFEKELYEKLRIQVPVIDACLGKIVRLTGEFKVVCEDENYQKLLDKFIENVPVGISGTSLYSFVDSYLSSILTYGNGIGEIIFDSNKNIKGLYVAHSPCIEVREGKTPLSREFYVGHGSSAVKVKNSEKIIFGALNPSANHPDGVSILRGLPSISSILLRIYESIGQNFDRVGNVRYAVTYKPSDPSEKAYAKERAMSIAKEWSEGMAASKNGQVRDFIAVGDVGIKVIGADNQIIDTEIPVRQLLEQLISKLSIPPFLLGLNWSTTEKMSTQQVDILTSELEYYRRIVNPAIKKIAKTYLRLCGCGADVSVEWSSINLQDELELSRARLYNAQAEQIELLNEERKLCFEQGDGHLND